MTFSSDSFKNSFQKQKPDHSGVRNKGAFEMSVSGGKENKETSV